MDEKFFRAADEALQRMVDAGNPTTADVRRKAGRTGPRSWRWRSQSCLASSMWNWGTTARSAGRNRLGIDGVCLYPTSERCGSLLPNQHVDPIDLFCSWQALSMIDRDEIHKALLVVLAKIPMAWIGGEQRKGFPFDVDEFFRRLGEHPESPESNRSQPW